MLTLASPWLLALLPLPWLVRRLAPPHRQARAALHAPFVGRLAELSGRSPQPGATVATSTRLQLVTLCAVWLLLVVAMARPVWLGEPLVKVVPTRDLLLAVDISGSMETGDFDDGAGAPLSRLDAVKQVLDAFLARREGDRLGLIVFGSGAFVQSPFTDDLDVVRLLLDETQPRMAGPKTALGDAIGLGMTLFERSELDERVMIVLTDGNDTGSLVPPQRAAEFARERDVTLHTIGVGDPATIGEEALDEALLQRIAAATGGEYFFAADRAALERVTRAIDALAPREAETITHRPQHALFHWPLAAALALSLPLPLLAAAGRGTRAPAGAAEAAE